MFGDCVWRCLLLDGDVSMHNLWLNLHTIHSSIVSSCCCYFLVVVVVFLSTQGFSFSLFTFQSSYLPVFLLLLPIWWLSPVFVRRSVSAFHNWLLRRLFILLLCRVAYMMFVCLLKEYGPANRTGSPQFKSYKIA